MLIIMFHEILDVYFSSITSLFLRVNQRWVTDEFIKKIDKKHRDTLRVQCPEFFYLWFFHSFNKKMHVNSLSASDSMQFFQEVQWCGVRLHTVLAMQSGVFPHLNSMLCYNAWILQFVNISVKNEIIFKTCLAVMNRLKQLCDFFRFFAKIFAKLACLHWQQIHSVYLVADYADSDWAYLLTMQPHNQ